MSVAIEKSHDWSAMVCNRSFVSCCYEAMLLSLCPMRLPCVLRVKWDYQVVINSLFFLFFDTTCTVLSVTDFIFQWNPVFIIKVNGCKIKIDTSSFYKCCVQWFPQRKSSQSTGNFIETAETKNRTWISQMRFKPVGGEGFEPPKASPIDLQSTPFDHSGIPP